MRSWPVTLSAMAAASLRPNTSSQWCRPLSGRLFHFQHVGGLTCGGPGSAWGASGRSWSPLCTICKAEGGALSCADADSRPRILFSVLPFSPSVQGLQRPDVGRPGPVPGDHDAFARSHPTDDVIHSRDDGDFGEAHHSVLEVFCFLQRLHSLNAAS